MCTVLKEQGYSVPVPGPTTARGLTADGGGTEQRAEQSLSRTVEMSSF